MGPDSWRGFELSSPLRIILRSCSLVHPASSKPAISNLAPQAPAAMTPDVAPSWYSGFEILSQEPSSTLPLRSSTALQLRFSAGLEVFSLLAEPSLLRLLLLCLLLVLRSPLPDFWLTPLSGGWARLRNISEVPKARGSVLRPGSLLRPFSSMSSTWFRNLITFFFCFSPRCIGEKL